LNCSRPPKWSSKELVRAGLGALGVGLMHCQKKLWFQASAAWLSSAVLLLFLLAFTMSSSSDSVSMSVPLTVTRMEINLK
jgi:hypothetical protein